MGDTLRQMRNPRSVRLRAVSAGNTDVGAVRKLNEDAYLERTGIGLWAVADGLGGESAGDRASRMVVEALGRVSQPVSAASFLTEVREQLLAVNRLLRLEATKIGPDLVVASTVVVLLIHGEHFACAWAGDSRLYRLRNNVLHRISTDHSAVQDLIDRGLIDVTQADNHPDANVLTRAVGAADELNLDLRQDQILLGDTFLLCSDGLTKMASDQEIEAQLQNHTPKDAVAQLMECALSRGAIDNVTVVVIQIVTADDANE
ncbi:MAG: PP2C family protein-serine/threonine phosphatase [Stellaceae bacterium]